MLHEGRCYYGCEDITLELMEKVRAKPHLGILDPFERDKTGSCEPPIIRPPHGNYRYSLDAPIVVHWAQLHRHKARLPPLTFAHSKFRHSRLRFFRRMHRWMYVTERYLTCLQMAKDEASRRGLDGSSLTFDDIISKPVNVPMSNWVNVHCHRH
jgi:hypothetical protein